MAKSSAWWQELQDGGGAPPLPPLPPPQVQKSRVCSGKTWPEGAALTHSSHMHPFFCVDELTDKAPLFPWRQAQSS